MEAKMGTSDTFSVRTAKGSAKDVEDAYSEVVAETTESYWKCQCWWYALR